MPNLQPVIWSKGTLLTPQHMQRQDRFVETLLQFRVDALHAQPWGLRRMVLSQEALAAGSLELSAATGIMPDGLLFDVPDSDPVPLPRPLRGFWPEDQPSLDVFLAIPAHRERGGNVSAGADGGTRFGRETMKLADENSGGRIREVEVARKNLRLLFAGEARDGTSALRIARLRRSAGGLIELDPHFIPPLLSIAASDQLLLIARRLVELLAAKSNALAGARRQRNQSLADFGAADIAAFWLLYTANSFLPVLHHFAETKKGHPEELFTLLASLGGALTTFSTHIQPRDVPRYDHDELGPCFMRLDELLRELLETVIPTNVISLLLGAVRPSLYATAISDDRYLVNSKLLLGVRADLPPAEVLAKAPRLLKVGAPSRIEMLVRQALPGLALLPLATRPSALSAKPNFHYFALNQQGEDWEAVRTGRALAVYAPADFPNVQLELVVLLATTV